MTYTYSYIINANAYKIHVKRTSSFSINIFSVRRHWSVLAVKGLEVNIL